MQDEVTQVQTESQAVADTGVTRIDPAQLRLRHAQINAKRHRKLPWVTIAKRIGVHDSALVQALNYQTTPGRKKILEKLDRLFARLEKEMAE